MPTPVKARLPALTRAAHADNIAGFDNCERVRAAGKERAQLVQAVGARKQDHNGNFVPRQILLVVRIRYRA
jgi:hypothetical protein